MVSKFKIWDAVQTVQEKDIRFLLQMGGKNVSVKTYVPKNAVGRIYQTYEDGTFLVHFSSNLHDMRHIFSPDELQPYNGPVPGEISFPPGMDYDDPGWSIDEN